MKVVLYQLIPELDMDHLMFEDLKTILAKSDGRIPAERYEAVYCGDLDVITPEDVYFIFNLAHPEGYTGRSMSVSDVVEFIPAPGCSMFYFCNMIGHVEVDFDKKRAMLPIVNHDFQKEEITRCGNFSIAFFDEYGFENIRCSKMVLKRCRYSQCQLGYKLLYWHDEQGKWREKEFLTRPKILFAETGFCSIPQEVLYEETNYGIKRRYGAFSSENFAALEKRYTDKHIPFEYL